MEEINLTEDNNLNNESNLNEEIAENFEETKAEETHVETTKKECYFRYYLFVLVNSIIGFLVLIYGLRHVFNFLSDKEILNLKNIALIPSIAVAATLVMLFMFLSLVFKKFFKKLYFSEVFLYIYVGGLTTAINLISWNYFYVIINTVVKNDNVSWKIAEAIAFVIAVAFAFFADKIVVFKSYSFMPKKIMTEIGTFIGARIVTELVNVVLMWAIIDMMKKNAGFGKIVASLVVIILNYIFSKYFVFTKVRKENEKSIKQSNE